MEGWMDEILSAYIYIYMYIKIRYPPRPPHVPTPVFSISALGRHGFLGCPCFHAFLRKAAGRRALMGSGACL